MNHVIGKGSEVGQRAPTNSVIADRKKNHEQRPSEVYGISQDLTTSHASRKTLWFPEHLRRPADLVRSVT